MEPKTRTKPVAGASVTAEEKPYGVRIDSGGHALHPGSGSLHERRVRRAAAAPRLRRGVQAEVDQ